MIEKRTRAVWGTRLGVVLAAAGSAVGLGNFLRFPGVAARNGGGAFMIPYFVAFLLLALPLCWIEWTLGRYGGRFGHGSAPGIFDAACGGRNRWVKYLGIPGVAGALGICFSYIWIESWTLAYSGFAATGSYAALSTPAEMKTFFAQYIAAGHPFSAAILPAYLCFLATFACNIWVLWNGINKGIERFCKALMPMLFLLGIVLVVRVATLGAPIRPDWSIGRAFGFLWNPDFAALGNGRVWLEAAGQVFFSTSVGIGILLTYATYMKPREDILLPSTTACMLNEFAEVIIGGSIVVPAAFLFFGPAGTTEAVGGGTFGLAFQTTPLIFNSMAGGRVLGTLWFLLLFLAGITSSISIIQPAIAFLEDEYGFNRKRVIAVTAALIFVSSHLAIFGKGALDELDFWFSSFGLPLFGLFESYVFIRYFGARRGWEELHEGALFRLPGIFKWVMAAVTPLFLIGVLGGWLLTDGWKTVLLVKESGGRLVPLYSGEELPWVIGTRLFIILLSVGMGWLIHLAWKERREENQE